MILAFHCMWLQFFIMLRLHCRSVPMALLYQWCWAGFLTVYTVNVNWAGCAGPQKCFSVNNIMHISVQLWQYILHSYGLVFLLCPLLWWRAKPKKWWPAFDFSRYRMLLHKLSWDYKFSFFATKLLEWFCSEKAQFII